MRATRNVRRAPQPESLPATRILTAIVLLAAFLAALFLLARVEFAGLLAVVMGIAGREWGRLTGLALPGQAGYALACGLAFAALAWVLWPVQWSQPSVSAVFALATVFWVGVAPLWLGSGVKPGARPLLRLAGFVVLLPAGIAMLALAPIELLALFALLWIADTAAYLAGRAYGRRRLAPTVSPGKTWEGAGAAMIGVLAYAIMCAVLVPQLVDHVRGTVWLPYLAGAALLCVLSIVGDLFESAVKRQAGLKDSGTLLPGHGGVLDRIDSATAMLPVGALLLHWIVSG